MSPCDFNQEGFCVAQDEYPEIKKCGFAKGKLQECTAKEEDLTEFCLDCNEPVEDCECGTNWVLAKASNGEIVPITPKEYRRVLEANPK